MFSHTLKFGSPWTNHYLHPRCVVAFLSRQEMFYISIEYTFCATLWTYGVNEKIIVVQGTVCCWWRLGARTFARSCRRPCEQEEMPSSSWLRIRIATPVTLLPKRQTTDICLEHAKERKRCVFSRNSVSWWDLIFKPRKIARLKSGPFMKFTHKTSQWMINVGSGVFCIKNWCLFARKLLIG